MRTPVTTNQMGQGYGVVIGSVAPPGKVLGDVYLDTVWHVGNILLESGAMLEGYRMRYDLKTERLEFQTTISVRVLDCRMIKSFLWVDKDTKRYFVNAASFAQDDKKLVGMLEVLADGSKPLIRRTALLIQQANYNHAFDVGSHDAKLYKHSTLFYITDGNLYPLKNKKDIFDALGDKEEQVETFAKANDLNLRKDDDVVRVFEYYNSLTQEKTEP